MSLPGADRARVCFRNRDGGTSTPQTQCDSCGLTTRLPGPELFGFSPSGGGGAGSRPRQTGPVRQLPVYYYSSVSNLIRRFATNLATTHKRPVLDLSEREVRASEPTGPWVLLTPSYKAGNDAHATLPAPVRSFLRSPATRRRLIGIIGSGNRNFGEHYQAAARELARVSRRPVIFEFELAGTPEDVAECARRLALFDARFAAEEADEPPD